ncbi:MAG: protein-disulfide isomerase [SAR86 cluster bacterium]|uniref:Thiol:disulfide interchange protein n=1 Tax=SAR86 cluster bacterium TaxID=2030880 RepID=A0A2A5AXX7_9GAMM|nr:MAG: protein-disulfide isomerase [SAR86 cluster bacterium]
MTSTLKRVIAVLGLILLASTAITSQAQRPQSLREKLVEAIETASQGQLKIVNLESTPLPNIYEVELSTGEVLYSDISGDYLFAGDMYQTSQAGLLNLSANKRQLRNLDKIAAIPEDEMIIFSPDEIKASITVFTDVDCTYCRALHRDLDTLLSLGIQIRYMAYPRGGENADSFSKMISVWCSDDRKKSLSQAKNGQNLPERNCDTPVLAHYELGNQLGITGTPALVFPDGKVIPGYLNPERLSVMLNIN